jgi:V8-like Glu-specific endopeptidase
MSEYVMRENRNPATFEELCDRSERRATREFPKVTTELCRIWHREGHRAMPTVRVTDGDRSYTVVEAVVGPGDSCEAPPIKSENPEARLRDFDPWMITELSTGAGCDFLDLRFLPTLTERLPESPLRKDEDRPTNVFGTDTRYVFNDTAFPWSTTGRVQTPSGVGTGCMIGRNLLLTCSHVMQWNSDGSVGWVKFEPAYYNGPRPQFGTAWGTYVLWWNKAQGGLTDFETAFDYVVVVLDRNLGDLTGYPGYRTYSDSWNGGIYWQHIGYPGDLTGAERPVFFGNGAVSSTANHSTSGQTGKVLGHFMDITGGHSGGPFWGWWSDEPWPRVIGVQSAEASTPAMTTSGDNEGGGGSALSALIAYARDNF